MIQSNLSAVVKSIVRNSFGVCAITETDPTMRKTNNPYVGRVKKVTYYTNIAVGRVYENGVNNRLEKEGLAPDFETEKQKGRTWVDFPYFEVSDKDPNQHYLRLTLNKNTTTRVIYMVDGREATNVEVDEIKTFLSNSNKSSAKQSAMGLADEDQVKTFAVKTENVVSLWQGTHCYDR